MHPQGGGTWRTIALTSLLLTDKSPAEVREMPGLAPHASFNTNGNASSTTPTPDPSAAAATSGGRARNAARGVGRGGRGGQSLEAPLLDESGGAENV